jgi:16S rRNA (guanine527-N7)-methyltransferase
MPDFAAVFGLSADQRQKLDDLALWSTNMEISGTSIKDPKRAYAVHIADSLSGLTNPELEAPESVADIGSGAGFPGLALAVARPETKFTLIDSERKKMESAARIARKLEIENVDCVWGRVEEVAAPGSELRETFDVVTARALADLGVLVEYAAPLLKVGGSLVAWKAELSEAESAGGIRAITELGFGAQAERQTEPFKGSRHHKFIVTQKLSPSPDRFPRRPGAALKNPL